MPHINKRIIFLSQARQQHFFLNNVLTFMRKNLNISCRNLKCHEMSKETVKVLSHVEKVNSVLKT